jgi:hypothetical protein
VATGTNRPFAHLPRAKKPQQIVFSLTDRDGDVLSQSALFPYVGKTMEAKNEAGGSIGVVTIEADGGVIYGRFEPWHDFGQYKPKIATEPEPELGPFEPGPPAKVSRRRVRRGRLG